MIGQVESLTDRINSAFDDAMAALLELRDRQYADAIAPLEAERESLGREWAGISEAKRNLEAILPAKTREAQRAADALLLKGKRAAAESRLREAQAAQAAPSQMEERLLKLSTRIAAIEAEERAIAREVFERWVAGDVPAVVRAAEHALFVVVLDGLEKSFYDYQERTGTNIATNAERPLIHLGRFSGLTANEKSPEWRASQKWYGLRR